MIEVKQQASLLLYCLLAEPGKRRRRSFSKISYYHSH
jgi:hypothetical protein